MIRVHDYLPGFDATPCTTLWRVTEGHWVESEHTIDGRGYWHPESYELVGAEANGCHITPAELLAMCYRAGWDDGLVTYYENLRDAVADGSAREQEPVIGSRAA